jgi:hypothetical protein
LGNVSPESRRAWELDPKNGAKITGNGGKDKTAVMGTFERRKVHAKAVGNNKKKTVQAEIRPLVSAGSALFIDALQSYERLNDFQHEAIDHAVEGVRCDVHTDA